MVKPGSTDSIGTPSDLTKLDQASKIVDDLSHGEDLDAGVICSAADTLIDLLQEGDDQMAGKAQDGLLDLYSNLSGEEAQAEVFGKLVAAGEPAKEVLDTLVQENKLTSFTEEELNILTESTKLSPDKQLAIMIKYKYAFSNRRLTRCSKYSENTKPKKIRTTPPITGLIIPVSVYASCRCPGLNAFTNSSPAMTK